MHNRIHARQQRVEQAQIADIPVHELVTGRVGDRREILEVARVGEGIEHDHFGTFEARIGVLKGAANEVRADETGAAGYEYFHEEHCFLFLGVKGVYPARSRGPDCRLDSCHPRKVSGVVASPNSQNWLGEFAPR